MIPILTIIFFVFGLIIGSFLNVVIFRFNTQKSFGGRSACMSCQNKLSWYELIPVVSFLGLRGRCRTCKTKISIQYPMVELATGVVFAALFLKFQNTFLFSTLSFTATYAYYAVAFSLLLVISVYDLKHKIIPDILSFGFGFLAFIGLFLFDRSFFPAFYPHLPSVAEFFYPLLIAICFALFWLISKGRWMGLGDAKLMVGLGWLLGFPLALSGAVLSFWIGSVIGLFLIIFSKKYRFKSELPFAPYLAVGVFLSFIFELHLF